MSWLPPVGASLSRIGTSIRPAPCADDIKKDQPKRPRAPIRMPKPRGCARCRQSRYNAKPNRTAAPLQVHLVEPLIRLHEELAVELEAAVIAGVEFGNPALQAIRIELIVPCLVQPVRNIDALAVAADLHHLRAAVERTGVRMRGA